MTDKVTVVVPTFNESENIPELFARIKKAMKGTHTTIMVVDDSFDTRTVDAAKTCAVTMAGPEFDIVARRRTGADRCGGLAGAVTDGLGQSTGADVIVVMDGDLQHPPELLPQLVEAVASGCDVAVASRYIEGGSSAGLSSTTRHAVSMASTWAAKGLFPRRLRGVTDPMTGYFAVRPMSIRLDRLRPQGFKILLEILVSHRLQVAEVPLEFGSRLNGESNGTLKQGFEFLGQLLRLRASLRAT